MFAVLYLNVRYYLLLAPTGAVHLSPFPSHNKILFLCLLHIISFTWNAPPHPIFILKFYWFFKAHLMKFFLIICRSVSPSSFLLQLFAFSYHMACTMPLFFTVFLLIKNLILFVVTTNLFSEREFNKNDCIRMPEKSDDRRRRMFQTQVMSIWESSQPLIVSL